MTDRLFLSKGAHTAASGEKCVNEFGAWVSGEEHSDMPHCFSPVGARLLMALNDRLPDDLRQQLLPLSIEMVGTNTGAADETVRRWMSADWALRGAARYWFAGAGRPDWCARVDALPVIVDHATALHAVSVLREIRADAIDAAVTAAAAAAVDAGAAAAGARQRAASAAAPAPASGRRGSCCCRRRLPSCVA